MSIFNDIFAYLADSEIKATPYEGSNFESSVLLIEKFLADLLKDPPKNEIYKVLRTLLSKEKLLGLMKELKQIKEIEIEMQEKRKIIKKTEPKSQEAKSNKILKDLAKSIMKQFKTKKNIYFPGGFLNQESGHFMVYQLTFDNLHNVIFKVHNTGNGLRYHQDAALPSGKEGYYPIYGFSIQKDLLIEENLVGFIENLLKLQIDHLEIQKNTYNTNKVYQSLDTGRIWLKGEALSEEQLGKPILGQRAGTCIAKSIKQIIKDYFNDQEVYDFFSLAFRLHLLEGCLDQEHIFSELSTHEIKLFKHCIENIDRVLSLKKIDLDKNLKETISNQLQNWQTALRAQQKDLKKFNHNDFPIRVGFGKIENSNFQTDPHLLRELIRFEDQNFIEYKVENNQECWRLSRYNLKIVKKNHAFQALDGKLTLLFTPQSNSKINFFRTGLILQRNDPKEIENSQVYLAPIQPFCVLRDEKDMPITSENQEHYIWQQDLSGYIQKTRKNNKSLAKHEEYISFEMKNNEPCVSCPGDNIFLIYLYLGHRKWKKAFDLLRNHRLEGTIDEMKYLYWIIEKLPDDKQEFKVRNSPLIALQTLAIYKMIELDKIIKREIKSKEVNPFNSEQEDFKYFIDTLYEEVTFQYQLYDKQRNNIPESLRLTPDQERTLIEYAQLHYEKNKKPTQPTYLGTLGARYLDNPHVSPTKIKDLFYKKKFSRKTSVSINPTEWNQNFDIASCYANKSIKIPPKNLMPLLSPWMDKSILFSHLADYYNIACSKESAEKDKDKITLFCKAVIGSDAKRYSIDNNEQKILCLAAEILWTGIHLREKIPLYDNQKINEHLIQKASQTSVEVSKVYTDYVKHSLPQRQILPMNSEPTYSSRIGSQNIEVKNAEKPKQEDSVKKQSSVSLQLEQNAIEDTSRSDLIETKSLSTSSLAQEKNNDGNNDNKNYYPLDNTNQKLQKSSTHREIVSASIRKVPNLFAISEYKKLVLTKFFVDLNRYIHLLYQQLENERNTSKFKKFYLFVEKINKNIKDKKLNFDPILEECSKLIKQAPNSALSQALLGIAFGCAMISMCLLLHPMMAYSFFPSPLFLIIELFPVINTHLLAITLVSSLTGLFSGALSIATKETPLQKSLYTLFNHIKKGKLEGPLSDNVANKQEKDSGSPNDSDDIHKPSSNDSNNRTT